MSDEKGLGLKSWLSGPKEKQARTGQTETSLLNRRRVAVLPFASMSPNPEDEYFADGMTEEVISTLSRVPEVQVISRTSVMHYKKNPQPIKTVSTELDVGTVLEGGVRKAGNKVRITVQMIDALSDRPVWADSYDRELKDIFAIQSEVAQKVAEALKIEYRGRQASLRKNPTGNAEAYTLYLKGRFNWNKRGLEDLRTAKSFFEEAVREDPGFALGYVGLADCHILLASNWDIDLDSYLEKSKALVAKALSLDPQLAEAHATQGLILQMEFRLAEADPEFRRAISLNPNYVPAHHWYHLQLRAEKRWKESLEHIQRAIELDPLSAALQTAHAWFYILRGDYASALPFAKRGTELDPNFAQARWGLALIYGRLGRLDQARNEYETVVKQVTSAYPLAQKGARAALARWANDKESLRKLLPDLEKNQDQIGVTRFAIAFFWFYLDEFDKAFDLLEESYAKREPDLIFISIFPEIPEKARSDPRYLSLLEKVGLD